MMNGQLLDNLIERLAPPASDEANIDEELHLGNRGTRHYIIHAE
jgi:hypothetical protein